MCPSIELTSIIHMSLVSQSVSIHNVKEDCKVREKAKDQKCQKKAEDAKDGWRKRKAAALDRAAYSAQREDVFHSLYTLCNKLLWIDAAVSSVRFV